MKVLSQPLFKSYYSVIKSVISATQLSLAALTLSITVTERPWALAHLILFKAAKP